MATHHILVVTDKNFKEVVLDSKVPTLVDFWADWCEPCHRIAPFVEQIAVEYHGKLNVGKMDIDESPEMPTKYNIRSIPTLIFFHHDQVIGQLIGAVSKARLESFVKECLAKI